MGSGQEYLAVHGDGSRYRVDILFDTGTDPHHDKIRHQRRVYIQVDCDEIVEIVAVVPEVSDLGTIVGRIDMIGEFETSQPFTVAGGGPLGNRRLDRHRPFELENMLPAAYQVQGQITFRNEFFVTPYRGGSNERVVVTAGETTDLGDTFVIDPGIVAGEIFLAGPPPGDTDSCLGDVGEESFVSAIGHDEPAAGATKSAVGGFAKTLFSGGFDSDPQTHAFEGYYRLALGGLLGEPSLWWGPRPHPGLPGPIEQPRELSELDGVDL